MSMPKKVLWKAADGKEFVIDTEELQLGTMQELYDHIDMLRQKYGYDKPTFSHVEAGPGHTLAELGVEAVNVSALPEELRCDVLDTIKEHKNREYDPKKLN